MHLFFSLSFSFGLAHFLFFLPFHFLLPTAQLAHSLFLFPLLSPSSLKARPSSPFFSTVRVTVRVFAMLEIYFVSVNYVFVSMKLMCVCVKL
jgi:hypothetical protein